MKHFCKYCEYSTNVLSSYKKHLTTYKHAEKVKEHTNNFKLILQQSKTIPKVVNTSHICPFCQNTYSNSSNLTKHKKICSEKERMQTEHATEIANLKKEMQNLKEFHQQLDKQKQDEINHLKTLINNAGAVIKTSVSALSYVTQNYGDAPVLKKLKDYSYLQEIDVDSDDDDEFDLSQLIINQHTDKTIVKYLGNIIVEAYKTEDPSKRSIWNSDSVRLTYIIRELINKKPDWTVDKKGVKTTKYIIAPLLEYIRHLMADFIENNRLENFLHDSEWRMKRRMDNLKAAGEICFNIKNKSLEEQILKYIAPHFYLDRNEQLIDG